MQINIKSIPFNVDLLILSPEDTKNVRAVKVLDIYDGSSKNLHPDGLFSTEIFGKYGEEKRNRTFSFINLNMGVFHPIIYKALVDLKSLYEGIISKKVYARWDDEIKDFVESDIIHGGTGFNFFLSHFKDIKFDGRNSTEREFNIKLVEKYKDNCIMDKLVVIPAGLRDYTIDEATKKPSQDEINLMYVKALSIAGIAENVNKSLNIEFLDTPRYNIQLTVLEIYNYIKSLMEGKNKLITGKWASRKIFHSTRNVATSYISESTELFGEKSVSTNQTVVGLYQFLRNILPLAVNKLRNGFLSEVFIGPNSPVILVNKKTLKKELVSIESSYFDKWMTYEGIESLIALYGQENIRHNPIEINGMYIGLIYLGKNTFKLIHDIDDVPTELKEGSVIRPITFTELLYLSIYKIANSILNIVTRYPVAGYGGIYPSYTYLKTTVKSEIRTELDHNWDKTENKAVEFPILNKPFYNSISVAQTHVKKLGLDFDGDKGSFTCLLTDDANEEGYKLLNSRKFYVGVDGKMSFSAATPITNLVLASMTD